MGRPNLIAILPPLLGSRLDLFQDVSTLDGGRHRTLRVSNAIDFVAAAGHKLLKSSFAGSRLNWIVTLPEKDIFQP
jgi:hypothetical protein